MAAAAAAALAAVIGWSSAASAAEPTKAEPSPAEVISSKAADAAKEAADKAKEAKETKAKAEKAAAEEKDAEKKIAAFGKAATVAGKAEDADKAAKAAADSAKAAAELAKSGKLGEAAAAAAAALSSKDDATAAAKAAAETFEPPAPAPATLNTGDTAWMLVSTALVMLMVPGLALFYCGMVRSKNVLGTMMHSMVALAIIGVEWVVIGYAMSFGPTKIGVMDKMDYSKSPPEVVKTDDGKPVKPGLVGFQSSFVALRGVPTAAVSDGTKFTKDGYKDQDPGGYAATIPVWVHMMFQGMFAIITPALISGAIAERVRFIPYCIFILLWGLIIYNPLAHWVWGYGILGMDGVRALDFAGGTVVHLSAGVSALACILLLPKRKDYPTEAIKPNSLVLTLLGAGLLWFGWFGFNGGSALMASDQAGQAFATTQTAAAAAGLGWVLIELLHRGKPTSLGLASGIVAGLVGITPAAGFVDLTGALIIGFGVAVVCYLAVQLKPLVGYDDSLDVVGVHGVGGAFGAIMTGILFVNAPDFAKVAGKDGLVLPPVATQLVRQLIAVGIAAVYCFVVTAVLVLALQFTIGFKNTEEQEEEGLDISEHGESGYHI
jgi:Amt family ammonium transporter